MIQALAGMFGFKLFGMGATAILGLIASGTLAAGVVWIKHDLEERGRKDAIAQIQQEQAEFNLMIQEDMDDHDIFLDGVYGDFQSEVAKIESQIPQTPVDELPLCPIDCRF